MPAMIDCGRKFEKQLLKCPDHIIQKVLVWIRTVEMYGVNEVRTRNGYNDKSLRGKRMDQRSVRLSRGYRLIYREKAENEIELIEVHKHDY